MDSITIPFRFTCDSAYSLGLTEMLAGLTFKQILSDLELVAGPKSGSILLSKKKTMPDRHIVYREKFNALLEDYIPPRYSSHCYRIFGDDDTR